MTRQNGMSDSEYVAYMEEMNWKPSATYWNDQYKIELDRRTRIGEALDDALRLLVRALDGEQISEADRIEIDRIRREAGAIGKGSRKS